MNNGKRLTRVALVGVASTVLLASCGGSGSKKSHIEPGGVAAELALGEKTEHQLLKHQTATLPNDLTTAPDKPWTTRILGRYYAKDPHVPNLMYSASCTTTEGTSKMFTSITTEKNGTASGMIIESALNSDGYMEPTGVARHFGECKEMHGIAASNSCTVVGALCRRHGNASKNEPFEKDMVANIANKRFRDWVTQPGFNGKIFDEEWLYEWDGGDLTQKPTMYVAGKATGNWEFGKQDLVYSTEENRYGLSLKAANGGHDGDSFFVVDRSDHSIDTSRGWKWACGGGHTIFNHAAYNPYSGKFAAICGLDVKATDVPALDVRPGDEQRRGYDSYGGFRVKVEGEKIGVGFLSVPAPHQNYGGGVTGLLPLDDGGFLGVFAAVPLSARSHRYHEEGPTSRIGIARFDTKGNLVGAIKWVVQDADWFYSYPQLAKLGDNRYLLGYAKMVRLSKRADDELGIYTYPTAMRLPESFHVIEIDKDGKKLTTEQTVQHGWGEQDRIVSIAPGKVAWAYIPNAQYHTEAQGKKAPLPNPRSREMSFSVYRQN